MKTSYKKYIRAMADEYGLDVKYYRKNPIGCCIKDKDGNVLCDIREDPYKNNKPVEEQWNQIWLTLAYGIVYPYTHRHPFYYEQENNEHDKE